MKKSLQNTSIYKKKKKKTQLTKKKKKILIKKTKKKKTRLTEEKENVLLKNTEILNACKNFSQKTWEMTQKQLSKHIKPKTSESQNKKLVKQT